MTSRLKRKDRKWAKLVDADWAYLIEDRLAVTKSAPARWANLRLMANKQNEKAGFADSACVGARDWHWTLRSMETQLTRLCVDCGEQVPEGGTRCNECMLDALND